jgi:hypothetical protein
MQIRSLDIDPGKTTFDPCSSWRQRQVLLMKKFTQLITFVGGEGRIRSGRSASRIWARLGHKRILHI